MMGAEMRPLLLWLTIVAFPSLTVCAASYRLQGKITRFAMLIALVSMFPTIAIWDSFVRLDQHTSVYIQPHSKQASSLITRSPDAASQQILDSNETTLKGAGVQAESTMVGALVALFTAVVAGLSILYSVFSLVNQRNQTDELHQEDYYKDMLMTFNTDQDVRNGKMILEALSQDSTYLPVLHLDLYHDPASARRDTESVKAKLDAAKIWYARETTTTTYVYAQCETVEVIPPLQVLIKALSPDCRTSRPDLLGNKICYSFDAFLEKFVVVGKLQIAQLKRQSKQERISLSRISDIQIWWDNIDLPYWSQLLLWGTVEVSEDKDPLALKPGDSTAAHRHFEYWLKGGLPEGWEEIELDYANLEDTSSHHSQDKALEARQMIWSYIQAYYPVALQIALVLAVSEFVSPNQDEDVRNSNEAKRREQHKPSDHEQLTKWLLPKDIRASSTPSFRTKKTHELTP